ncbi:hypothetical protein G7Z17_g1152 [Cylindrodendrum hubeiense]|uniref:NmrA-like domain-containing protein n=1 Tax=Cylindrodendrum hubeiense TaxID=595255 RepID=A0A9P5HFD8_9HYPO|nr:hypothetical protein G7Z17_g1152 [Cylindrodendrum hubeiense]
MSKKTVSVVGATGTQGGSVVRALVKDGSYHVRAITRNPQSDGGKALAKSGAQVVQADVNDYNSLEKAFEGSHVIYALTDFFEPFSKSGHEEAIKIEVQQGINLANAATATTSLEHFIWSTLPNAKRISNGKHLIPHFESKNEIDDYIKSNAPLFKKTTFLWIAFYAANFRFPMWTPFPIPTSGSGKYIQLQASPPSVPINSSGDTEVNVGIFVKSIISQPEKTRGKFVLADVESMNAGELLRTWAKAQGKQAEYIQIDKEAYYGLWPGLAEEMEKMLVFWAEAKEKSWTGEDEILTKDDLGITGLVTTAEAFAKMKDWN